MNLEDSSEDFCHLLILKYSLHILGEKILNFDNCFTLHPGSGLIILTYYFWYLIVSTPDLCTLTYLVTKIVSENDQEIPQSQTADVPMAPRGRATQQKRDTRKTN